jgi:hypothetical protein
MPYLPVSVINQGKQIENGLTSVEDKITHKTPTKPIVKNESPTLDEKLFGPSVFHPDT